MFLFRHRKYSRGGRGLIEGILIAANQKKSVSVGITLCVSLAQKRLQFQASFIVPKIFLRGYRYTSRIKCNIILYCVECVQQEILCTLVRRPHHQRRVVCHCEHLLEMTVKIGVNGSSTGKITEMNTK